MACCNHQHWPHSSPTPSPTHLCCPNPSHYQSHTRPNHHNSDVLPSLLRRIHLLESSLLRPSPSPPPPTLRDFAARTIQSRFRASLLRRARAFREINDLASVQSSLHLLNSSIRPHKTIDPSSLSRHAMDLIARLRTVQGVDKMTKEGKALILKDFAQFLEVVNGMMCGRRSDDPYKTVKDIRMGRNDGDSWVSCAAREIAGVCHRGELSKQRCLDRDVNRLIDELNERAKRIQKVSEVLEGKDGIVEDGNKCFKCCKGGLIPKHGLQSNAEKRVRFQEDEDATRVCNFAEYSTSWGHNFDEYKKEPVSRLCDGGAIIVYNFDEYSATRVHNFDEFRKEPLSRPCDENFTIYDYSATRIHDFDEYREESLSKPSDNVTNTEDAVTQQHEDDEEMESDAEENVLESVEGNEEEDEENGTASNEFLQGSDGESLESDIEENLAESAEVGEDEDEENDFSQGRDGEVDEDDEDEENDFSQGRDGEVDEDDEDLESLEGGIEENPEESAEGSEGEDETEYESSEYEDETENEGCEDEDEMEDEGYEDETEDEEGEDEDETENGTHNDIPQDNKQSCDSAAMTSANVANSAQLAEQRTKHRHEEFATFSDIYAINMADEMSRRMRLRNVICHQCNKRGHIKRNCWYNPARRCGDCNMLGHTREVCTHFNDQTQNS